MRRYYNHVAGQSVERLAALSDGVFAVAMTLLVLDLKTPAASLIHSEDDLWRALTGVAPTFGMYLMSFLTLGIFWVGQQTQLNDLRRSDRDLTWIHLGFLFAVSLLPFSTSLLAGLFEYRIALAIYWLNILLLGLMLLWSWRHIMGAELLKDGTPRERHGQITSRIIVAQSLYAFGAALCVFGTIYSIAFILMVQLNYVFAPRIKFLDRL
jgi:uncharacterized membrane protein